MANWALKVGMVAGIAFSGMVSAEDQIVLASVSNDVLVNQGDTYVPAQEGMILSPGDQIMVMDGAEAEVKYSDGCEYKMNGSEMLQIRDISECDKVAQLGGSSSSSSSSSSTSSTSSSGGKEGIDTAVLVAGAVVAGGAIYVVTDDSPEEFFFPLPVW